MAKKTKYFPVYLLSHLPMSVMYQLSNLTYLILYYVVGYRKKTVRENLVGSFPDKHFDEIVRIEKDFYRHFSDLLVESAKFITISKSDIKQRFTVKNPELFEKYYNEGRSVIMYTAHLGNWEWLAALPLWLPHKVTTFYQPLASSYFEELMKTSREKFGAIAVPSGQGYKKLVEFASQEILTATCIIGDQRPKRKSSTHRVRFLNRDTDFLIGADRIAKKSNQPVVFCLVKKVSRGRYALELVPIEENPLEAPSEQIIDAYARELEKAILDQPHLWLWTHKRWKTKPQRPSAEGATVPLQ
jgi:Kdo2-lipid IVA lauroyltransferase/acyltransferase